MSLWLALEASVCAMLSASCDRSSEMSGLMQRGLIKAVGLRELEEWPAFRLGSESALTSCRVTTEVTLPLSKHSLITNLQRSRSTSNWSIPRQQARQRLLAAVLQISQPLEVLVLKLGSEVRYIILMLVEAVLPRSLVHNVLGTDMC